MTGFWQRLAYALETSDKLLLLLVVHSLGSSPGKTTAKLFLTDQGSSFGTIGGGEIEAKLLRFAKKQLLDDAFSWQLIRRQHRLDAATQPSGMICGGEQTVLIYRCRHHDKALFSKLAESPTGQLKFSPVGIQWQQDSELTKPHSFSYQTDTDWYYQENIGQRRAYIIGSGHVGLALSKILASLNFSITLVDDREPLTSLVNRKDVTIKRCLNYHGIADYVTEGAESFVFIMTSGHKSDARVLAQLVNKNFAFLGVLGSHNKVATLKAGLADVVSDKALAAIYAPMGLPIGSHSPEEIAISIAAQLIQLINAAVPTQSKCAV